MLHHVELGGDERPTLLLHGFLGSGRNLRTLASGWARRDPTRRLVLLDLPGHGQSPPLPEDATLRDLAQEVLGTARALGLPTPWTLVGHSLGGRVALVAASLAPREVGSVTMLDVAPGPIPRSRQGSVPVLEALLRAPATAPDRRAMRAWLVEEGELPEPIADWLLLNLEQEAGRVRWRIERERLAELHPRVSSEDLWPIAESRPAPLIVVRGARSRYVSPEELTRLQGLGALTATVDAGHDVHVEAPEEVLNVIA